VSVGLLFLACVLSAHATGRRQYSDDETKVIVKAIPSPVRFETSRNVGAGRIVRSREGSEGTVTRTYRVLFKDGKPVGKELLNEKVTQAQPTVFLVGSAGHTFSRGSFVRHKVLTMRATSYYSMVCGTGRTATGERAKFGVVAVDPRVIPLGSRLFIEGYGMALACDVGGAIKGDRIDLCFENRGQVGSFRSKKVRVHVLD
jgi:3D (Asp-Asp-Asp) domain-containing protein